MKKMEIRQYTPKQELPHFTPPNVITTRRDTKIIKMYPPKRNGPPIGELCEVLTLTEKDAKIKLGYSHYENGGLFISYDERHNYFREAQPILTPEKTSINLDDIPDDRYAEMREAVINYLVKNKLSTKSKLKNTHLETMLETFDVPQNIFETI